MLNVGGESPKRSVVRKTQSGTSSGMKDQLTWRPSGTKYDSNLRASRTCNPGTRIVSELDGLDPFLWSQLIDTTKNQ